MSKNVVSSRDSLLEHLKDGWVLGLSSTDTRYWIQKPDLGCGGETKSVRSTAVDILLREKVIERKNRPNDPFYLTRFRLVKK
tara:strand:+ start:538 stop:783 length:246 start_codon:yes stop_codon:yes gene_type:complete